MDTFESTLKSESNRIDQKLKTWLPNTGATRLLQFNEAVRYSALAGGKRIRPILCLFVAEAYGIGLDAAIKTGCAIELIHCYSLVHDDLPAMDNDDFRRGKPTNHKVYGEAVAILVGDSLLTLAFKWLSELEQLGVSPEKCLQIISLISSAAGHEGMIGGQILDLAGENKDLSFEDLKAIHSRKTGALIKAPIICGALLANAPEADLEKLTLFSEKLGLLFQVVDDILDIEGDLETLGKLPGSDIKLGKSTYPSILGIDVAKKMASELYQEAVEILDGLSVTNTKLLKLTEFLYTRKN